MTESRDVLDAASREPVTITKHQKPRFVLMSVHCYETLITRSEQETSVLEGDLEKHEDRRVDETRIKSDGRVKPSEAFARHFGEMHGVDLPPPIRRRYRPLFMANEET